MFQKRAVPALVGRRVSLGGLGVGGGRNKTKVLQKKLDVRKQSIRIHTKKKKILRISVDIS